MAVSIRKEDALEYHARGRAGKIEIHPTKPLVTQRDLALAYTPGVAIPCLEIQKDPGLAAKYTARSNLVAVVSNGTATLGLGDIGALACKPVMEGKGCLFKRFADIDVFDIEIDVRDPQDVIRVVRALEPTFGGINLEDIKAPECFEIEEALKEQMNIPVFHDDQHGTAIITGAALLNALEITDKDISTVRVVVSGAGASANACARFWESLGVLRANIVMCDTKGVIYKGRTAGMNKYKEYFASDTQARTLTEALEGADVFLGNSVGGVVSGEMLRRMAPEPIVFALANPDPEITYPDAIAARPDVLMATGRSDYPNQVNNVLGFPFIFRGALDVQARAINEAMKQAAAHALAALAREQVPESVKSAYDGMSLSFGREYIIPKPFDPRVLTRVAPAVARAAMETGVARIQIDLEEYRARLETYYGPTHRVMRRYVAAAQKEPRKARIVFPEGDDPRVLRACQVLCDEGIATPILLGEEEEIRRLERDLKLDLSCRIEVIEPRLSPNRDRYIQEFQRLRARKGITFEEARRLVSRRPYFGSLMVHMGDAEGYVGGCSRHYGDAIKPVLQVNGPGSASNAIVCGMDMLVHKRGELFFADTAIHPEPTAEIAARIALECADWMRNVGIEPRVAFISYSSFGASREEMATKMAKAAKLLNEWRPDIEADGEIQPHLALDRKRREELYPFTRLKNDANLLIFPGLSSSHAAVRLLTTLGGAEYIGPIMIGMPRPATILTRAVSVDGIVHMTTLTVAAATERAKLLQAR